MHEMSLGFEEIGTALLVWCLNIQFSWRACYTSTQEASVDSEEADRSASGLDVLDGVFSQGASQEGG